MPADSIAPQLTLEQAAAALEQRLAAIEQQVAALAAIVQRLVEIEGARPVREDREIKEEKAPKRTRPKRVRVCRKHPPMTDEKRRRIHDKKDRGLTYDEIVALEDASIGAIARVLQKPRPQDPPVRRRVRRLAEGARA